MDEEERESYNEFDVNRKTYKKQQLRVGHLKRKEKSGVRLRESEQMEKKGKSPKYIEKVKQAEDAWEERAQKIQAGEIQNTWDMLEERGFIKDVAG
jgi:hypothetical protein